MTKAKLFWAILLLLALVPLAGALPGVGRDSQPDDENGALIIGEAGERYPVYGTGGIKVTGGHHGMMMSNMKRSSIEIDGSLISVQRFASHNESADFNAVANSAHFVSNAAVCTFPPASSAPGQEIIVCNTNNTTITYKTSGEDKLIAGPREMNANATFGKVDRFISDGRNWFHE
jgi:hypothetical protein